VRRIIEVLDQQGFETWLVGGCVRDLCLGLEPEDFDLATDALPDQVLSLFQHTFATGLKHGTITVICQDLAVEITTFRSEGPYSDSRRPDLVIFHDQIEADLSRRDFTMNSMAWRPDRGLLDLHGGLDDLRQGCLRCVGDPWTRFREDALRLMRAIRFALNFNLQPAEDLVQAAAELSDRLEKLSRERLTAEMLRILAAPYAERLASFCGSGLMATATRLLLQVEIDDHVLCQRLARLIRPGLAPEERLPLLLLAAVSPSCGPQSLGSVLDPYFKAYAGHSIQNLLMERSRLSRRQAQAGEAMLYLARLRLLLPVDRILAEVTQRRLLRLLARHCHLAADEVWLVARQSGRLLALCLHEQPGGQEQKLFLPPPAKKPPLVLADLAINGRKLQEMGCRTGPPMRILLEKLLSQVIVDPGLNQPVKLADLAARLLAGGARDK
jgi:tRNA nucleotidyltransferase (CCA-adding enzyme)